MKPGFKAKTIFNFLLSPYFIALIVCLFLFIFIPPIEKYKIELTDSWIIGKDYAHSYYRDLDHDGKSEYILSYSSRDKRHAIKVMSHDKKIINQWNFSGSCPERGNRTFTGDYNNNDQDEIFVFSQTGDSIMLHYFEPLNKESSEFRNIFIDSISRNYSKKNDYSIGPHKLIDLNNDGYRDLIFNINAGFSIQPRKQYIYDIKNSKLIRSPAMGVVLHSLKYEDIDNDGFPEITGNCSSPGNIKDSMNIPYDDNSVWLIVFDHKLNFEFEPIEFSGARSILTTVPVKFGDSSYIAVTYHNTGTVDSIAHIAFYSSKGKHIKRIDLPGDYLSLFSDADQKNKKYYCITEDHTVYKINKNLNISPVCKLENKATLISRALDIDSDGKNEFIFNQSNSNQISISRNNFKHHVDFYPDASQPFYFKDYSIKLNGSLKSQLYVQLGSQCFLFNYYKNPYYWTKWLLYAGLYLAVLLFILLIRWLYKIQIESRIRLEKQISELQFNSLNNQLSPHFILNAMNSITAAVYKENKKDAYLFGTRFSNLMREVLLSSEHISRSLEKELKFVENYLELERFRFNRQFDYKIDIQEDVDTDAAVPKMIIQTFVENAVKHGISLLKLKGLINIEIKKKVNAVMIIVEDNGIGRQKAQEFKTSGTGKGLKIVNQIIHLYEKLTQKRIIILTDDVEPHGSRVIIQIPD